MRKAKNILSQFDANNQGLKHLEESTYSLVGRDKHDEMHASKQVSVVQSKLMNIFLKGEDDTVIAYYEGHQVKTKVANFFNFTVDIAGTAMEQWYDIRDMAMNNPSTRLIRQLKANINHTHDHHSYRKWEYRSEFNEGKRGSTVSYLIGFKVGGVLVGYDS